MEFIEIARFSSRLEAETIGHALDSYEIPFLVQSHDVGMFGPGHTGPTPSGAGLCVPANRAEEASELLHCAINPVEDEVNTERRPEPETNHPNSEEDR